MPAFFKATNPHKILTTMKVAAFILGAYLTSPAPAVYTTLFWGIVCLISMTWAAWSFARLEHRKRTYNHDFYAILSILAWGAALWLEKENTAPIVITLIRSASIGFMAVFLAIILFTGQLIGHLRYRGLHKQPPPSPPAPEQSLLGL